jgi:hypothetical protein
MAADLKKTRANYPPESLGFFNRQDAKVAKVDWM